MADNSLPERELSKPETAQKSAVDTERRAFMGRAAIAALPVVLATVRGRTASAWGGTSTPSCPASANMSSCSSK